MNRISVLGWPAKINKDLNPYNYILYTSIEKFDIKVIEFNTQNLLKINTYDLVHMHWPENIFLVNSYIRMLRNLLFFFFLFSFLKIAKKKIIWTVHNFKPHENKYPAASKIVHNILLNRIDAYICLTKYSANELEQKLAPDKKNKIYVVSHPLYKEFYKNETTKSQSLKKFNISENKFVFLFIGQVRSYKNVISLIKAFKAANIKDALLIIAGKVHDEVKEEIINVTKGVESIMLFPEFINDNDLQYFYNVCDLVVVPYKNVLNSGTAFLNLTFNKPMLVPNAGAFLELREMVGHKAIHIYNGELNASHLIESRTIAYDIEDIQKINNFEPDKIALETIAVYDNVLLDINSNEKI